ncbi:Trehalose transport system permease protein SugB [Bacillus sp. THAF10]|uniref:ABC transporter permease n=1 Tax=Bacillus sp. THAF10 TaxID=2587848 RepID=UPI0012A8C5AE|nr:ABC transporter permease subunit [Bacillus sp. THAF10]QFT91146.1 Trehalose transport system permease protein SugB [Bacillus sp. THAF10]
MVRSKLLILIWLVPFALVLCGFLLAPLVNMLVQSFRGSDGAFGLEQFQIIFSDAFYLQSITNSLQISIISASIAIIIAAIGGYSITTLASRGNKYMVMITNMTSYFEGIPLAVSFIVLLGNNGLFTLLFSELGLPIAESFNLYSWVGLIIVYVYFQVPFAIMLLLPTYQALNNEWRYASNLLGGRSLQYWLKIGLPVLLPGIFGTYTILLANSLGAYATAYALVGSTYNLIPLQIGSLISGDVFLDPNLASAFGVILAVIMLGSLWLNEKIMRKVRRDIK